MKSDVRWLKFLMQTEVDKIHLQMQLNRCHEIETKMIIISSLFNPKTGEAKIKFKEKKGFQLIQEWGSQMSLNSYEKALFLSFN